jgi:hypothetical protein
MDIQWQFCLHKNLIINSSNIRANYYIFVVLTRFEYNNISGNVLIGFQGNLFLNL